jgi:hypothetical protein
MRIKAGDPRQCTYLPEEFEKKKTRHACYILAKKYDIHKYKAATKN